MAGVAENSLLTVSLRITGGRGAHPSSLQLHVLPRVPSSTKHKLEGN